jgi:hypothetical protein
MMASPEDFRPGDPVRKFVTEWNVTPFCGIVTHIVPATNKVWVQWPVEHSQESPETLVRVNPTIFGLPSVLKDKGYDSYEKQLSEKTYGRIPKGASEQDKMALRIAHTFATDVVGKLVDDIVADQEQGLSDVQTYFRIFPKYADICSDYIIQSSIKRIYASKQASVPREKLMDEVLWVIDENGVRVWKGEKGKKPEKEDLEDAYLVGWQAGSKPSVVAIISGKKLSKNDAEEIARKYLKKTVFHPFTDAAKWCDKEADYFSMPKE